MEKIKTFAPNNLKQLRVEIDAALKPIAEKYGLQSIHLGSMSYKPGEFTGKLLGTLDAAECPEMVTQNKNYSQMMGYSDNIVGLTFISNSKQFKVTKIEINRPKYPIVAECLGDQRLYKFKANGPLKFQKSEIKYDASRNLFSVHA